MEELYCQGCGARVQTDDESKVGYAPKSALQRDEIVCKRCFRLKHYNEVQDVDMTADDFLNMLHEIGHKDGLIVKVVDLFDVHGSFIQGLNRIAGSNPIVLVGNKVDLLPKSTKLNKVKNWMRRVAKEYGLKVEDVFLVSATTGVNMKEMAFELERIRKGKDIYVVGSTNVGKSTLINHFIQNATEEKDVITTSYFPGTTLGFIDIPLDDRSSMIDTPGIINHHQMSHYLSKQDLKTVTPKKEVKPKVFQLNEGQTLFVGGLARFDIEQAKSNIGYVCYFSNDLNIHRTKQEKANELYEQHLGDLLSPPTEDSLKSWPEMVKETFKVNASKKTDIVFSGLGWVTIPEGEVTISAYVPKGVRVMKREAII
ncbi:ribosome biogenesis GTPase YqeH [Piscibacillus sp. B03]|uniref:ribosome biogenesis GTPase YqeH n=1 Tax=Piscibacillus sp. B03 TaxID=3457430 RepID=UPI003FCEC2FF